MFVFIFHPTRYWIYLVLLFAIICNNIQYNFRINRCMPEFNFQLFYVNSSSETNSEKADDSAVNSYLMQLYQIQNWNLLAHVSCPMSSFSVQNVRLDHFELHKDTFRSMIIIIISIRKYNRIQYWIFNPIEFFLKCGKCARGASTLFSRNDENWIATYCRGPHNLLTGLSAIIHIYNIIIMILSPTFIDREIKMFFNRNGFFSRNFLSDRNWIWLW